jgi:hypothetical protein
MKKLLLLCFLLAACDQAAVGRMEAYVYENCKQDIITSGQGTTKVYRCNDGNTYEWFDLYNKMLKQ